MRRLPCMQWCWVDNSPMGFGELSNPLMYKRDTFIGGQHWHYLNHSGYGLRDSPHLETGSRRPSLLGVQTWSACRPQLVEQSWTGLRCGLYNSCGGPSPRANYLSAAVKIHCLSSLASSYNLLERRGGWCRPTYPRIVEDIIVMCFSVLFRTSGHVSVQILQVDTTIRDSGCTWRRKHEACVNIVWVCLDCSWMEVPAYSNPLCQCKADSSALYGTFMFWRLCFVSVTWLFKS